MTKIVVIASNQQIYDESKFLISVNYSFSVIKIAVVST